MEEAPEQISSRRNHANGASLRAAARARHLRDHVEMGMVTVAANVSPSCDLTTGAGCSETEVQAAYVRRLAGEIFRKCEIRHQAKYSEN